MRLIKGVCGAAVAVLMLGACSPESLVEAGISASDGGDVDLDFGSGGISIEGEDGAIEIDFEDGNFKIEGPDGEVIGGDFEITDDGVVIEGVDEEGNDFGVVVDGGDETGAITISTEDGEVAIATTDGVPETWPHELLPIYPGATAPSAGTTYVSGEASNWGVLLQSDDAIEDILAFYSDDAGWDSVQVTATSVSKQSDTAIAQVAVFEDQGQQMINLGVQQTS